MARFQSEYSAEERATLTAAIVDRGMTAPAAREAQVRGELGITASTIPLGTVRTWARLERRRRAETGVGDIDALAADTGRALTGVARASLRIIGQDLQRAQRLKQGEPARAEIVRNAARAGLEILRLQRGIEEGRAPKQAGPKQPPKPVQDPEAEALEREAAERAGTPTPTPKGGESGRAESNGASTAEDVDGGAAAAVMHET